MRATSTAKKDGRPDPDSNRDNSTVQPGDKKVLMDVKGPGVITHIWITFLGPEPHPWAKKGSADHQDMLLRMYSRWIERHGLKSEIVDLLEAEGGLKSVTVHVVGEYAYGWM